MKKGGSCLRRGEGSTRKVRSDKKVDVKPTVSAFVKKDLTTYAYLINAPVMTAIEHLVYRGLHSDIVLLLFQPLLQRNYFFENKMYKGNRTNDLKITYRGNRAKVSFRMEKETYDKLSELAYCIGKTPTTTAALLIKKTLYNQEFMEKITKLDFGHLDEEGKRTLEKFLAEMRRARKK